MLPVDDVVDEMEWNGMHEELWLTWGERGVLKWRLGTPFMVRGVVVVASSTTDF